jgi:4-aminobutyrate aminotransferase-like enzyme
MFFTIFLHFYCCVDECDDDNDDDVFANVAKAVEQCRKEKRPLACFIHETILGCAGQVKHLVGCSLLF